MPSVFGIKRRDNLPLLKATLWENEEKTVPADLTNAEFVTLKVGNPGQTLFINRTVTIVEPRTAGKVETQISSIESNQQPNSYKMEFEVTWTGAAPQDISTYPKVDFLTFTVHADLDPPD